MTGRCSHHSGHAANERFFRAPFTQRSLGQQGALLFVVLLGGVVNGIVKPDGQADQVWLPRLVQTGVQPQQHPIDVSQGVIVAMRLAIQGGEYSFGLIEKDASGGRHSVLESVTRD